MQPREGSYPCSSWVVMRCRFICPKQAALRVISKVKLTSSNSRRAASHGLENRRYSRISLAASSPRASRARAIRELVPARQEVFMLHYWMGLTTREIAVVTKKGEPLVKAHLQRGRKQMRRWLTENGMEHGMSEEALKAIRKDEVRESGWDLLVKKDD